MLPFDCLFSPAITKCNDGTSLLIVQYNKCYVLNCCPHYLSPSIERIIWIGFYKNVTNCKCLIAKLPKDVVIHILHLLGKQFKLMAKPSIMIGV